MRVRTLSDGVGIVGGCGWMGRAIARAMLAASVLAPEDLWISNRSGRRHALEGWPGVHFTTDNQTLVEHCDTVLLSVRPEDFPAIAVAAKGKLVISVMAQISIDQIAEHTGAREIVRALPNAAAEIAQSYTPWFASAAVDDNGRDLVGRLFEACGLADQVPDEDQIDYFTGLTGSGPAFIAFYADAMIAASRAAGIDATLAERAVSQLFRGGISLLQASGQSPAEAVQTFLDYRGTTASGLRALEDAGVARGIAAGLDAAYRAAKSGSR